jgi:hypothetical protein
MECAGFFIYCRDFGSIFIIEIFCELVRKANQ